MKDRCTYRIRLQGQVDEKELNAAGPLEVMVIPKARTVTLITLPTDQSGLIGLLRHLHGQGFILLSVVRKP